MKKNIETFSYFLCVIFNSSLNSRKFPKNLKLAVITLLYKKGENDIKGNYRPVGILSNLSKMFEKCIFTQMPQFFKYIFSKYQCGFRRRRTMLEKWKNPLTMEKPLLLYWRIYQRLFDCLDHELLIAKLGAYGFSLPVLKLMHDYLSNRKQQTKIKLSYSNWHDIIFGVPYVVLFWRTYFLISF